MIIIIIIIIVVVNRISNDIQCTRIPRAWRWRGRRGPWRRTWPAPPASPSCPAPPDAQHRLTMAAKQSPSTRLGPVHKAARLLVLRPQTLSTKKQTCTALVQLPQLRSRTSFLPVSDAPLESCASRHPIQSKAAVEPSASPRIRGRRNPPAKAGGRCQALIMSPRPPRLLGAIASMARASAVGARPPPRLPVLREAPCARVRTHCSPSACMFCTQSRFSGMCISDYTYLSYYIKSLYIFYSV